MDFLRQLSGVFCENGLAYISEDEGTQHEDTVQTVQSETKAEDETFRLQVFMPMTEDKREAKALSDADDTEKNTGDEPNDTASLGD